MYLKVLTAVTAIVAVVSMALPTGAAAEGGPTVRWALGEEPVFVPQELEATSEKTSFALETSVKSPYFAKEGRIRCSTKELHGTLESNEGPTTIAFGSAKFKGELPPSGHACETTIPSPTGVGTMHAEITVNGESGGWTNELFTNGTSEFPGLMEFSVLFSAYFPSVGSWLNFAGCTYSKTGVEATYEEAPQFFELTVPPQAMTVGGVSSGYCPNANLVATFPITSFEPFLITNP
jgi:hypothetical protein